MNNNNGDYLNQSRSFIESAKSIAIAVNSVPTVDSIGAALSLYLSLSSLGKQVSIALASPMTVEFSRLVGVDKITNNFSSSQGKNLVISFPYQEGSIEKVSYNIENDTFNLVIEPREGYPQVTPDMMQYSSGSGDFDLIITIDAPSLENLGTLYQQNQQLFRTKNLINIDSHEENSRFAKVNYVDPTSSSTSELVLSLLSRLNYKIDPDIATNLLYGISYASNNFTGRKTGASTFEAAAICLRQGARKKDAQFQPMPKNPNTNAFTRQPFSQANLPQAVKPFPNMMKQKPAYPSSPAQSLGLNNQMKPQTNVSTQPIQQDQPQAETPPDWLKPKIYKGSTLL